MTTNQPDDVITKADLTCHDADYVRSLEERITVLQGQLDAWTERFARDTQVLQDRIGELTDLLSLTQRESANSLIAYAKLRQEHTRLKYSLSRMQPHPQQALHHDELGPILKDDLCPDALRDGRLERSKESRERILAKHPQEGDYGIELLAQGATECTRPNCPTQPPHRHLTSSPGISTSTNNAMHPLDDPLSQQALRIKATLDDSPDNDVTPVKANPNIVKTVADYAREKFDRAQGALRALQDSALVSRPQDPVLGAMLDIAKADASGPDVVDDEPPYNGKVSLKPPMDVNNIVGGPNEPALAAERREIAEQAAADALNRAFEEVPVRAFGLSSDETLNTPDKKTEDQ